MERILSLLGAGERGLAESLGPEARRRHFALGRLAAHAAVRALVGDRETRDHPEILKGPSGEPVVRGNESVRDVRVSVSHTRGLATACAWKDETLSFGIDVERVRPTSTLDGPYAFSRGERERFRPFFDPSLAVLGAWSVKEASWKAFVLDPREGPEAVEIQEFDPAAGRAVVRAAPPRPRDAVARAHVGRWRAAGAGYVWAVAWTRPPAQNW